MLVIPVPPTARQNKRAEMCLRWGLLWTLFAFPYMHIYLYFEYDAPKKRSDVGVAAAQNSNNLPKIPPTTTAATPAATLWSFAVPICMHAYVCVGTRSSRRRRRCFKAPSYSHSFSSSFSLGWKHSVVAQCAKCTQLPTTTPTPASLPASTKAKEPRREWEWE